MLRTFRLARLEAGACNRRINKDLGRAFAIMNVLDLKKLRGRRDLLNYGQRI